MSTTAVIVTYQTDPADLTACCRSLQANGVDRSIIVDNSPHETIASTAQRFKAQYFPQPENRGFAAGANRGAGRSPADTDYLLFLNPDAQLAPGALAIAKSSLARHPRAAVAGLALHDPAGRPEARSFGPPVTPLSLFTRHVRVSKKPRVAAAGKLSELAQLNLASGGRQQAPAVGRGASGDRTRGFLEHETGWVSGGAMLVRADTFRSLGGFDEQFFLYWEDVDFCRRVRVAGWAVVYVPAARVFHRRGASLPDMAGKTRRYDESADKYFRKHYAKPTWQLLRAARFFYRYGRRQVV